MIQPSSSAHAGLRLAVTAETFPIAGSFRIARGSRTEARVVVATLTDGSHVGRGECVPYGHYGETVEGVIAAIEAMAPDLAAGLDRAALQAALPPGAARNALDCALWDLEAKRSGQPVWRLAGLSEPKPLETAYTISVGQPEAMAKAAAASGRPLLKLKLTGEGDLDRVRAVREAAPAARLIVDANESWSLDQLDREAGALAALGVELIEQPLPANGDVALAGRADPVALAADESCHDRHDLDRLVGRYRVINIKLDKTGGLTEALALKQEAEVLGFAIMVGCMVGTSLAMAPALLVAQGARVVDLDGPLLLVADRPGGLVYDGAMVHPAAAEFWG